MGQDIQVDGGVRVGNRLQKAAVGAPAGLAEQSVFGAHEGGETAFEAALRAALADEDGGHQEAVALFGQAFGLRRDDLRMRGKR